MKFRKKPLIIEAEQWFKDKEVPGVLYGHIMVGYTNSGSLESSTVIAPYVATLEGPLLVSEGDWIVTGVNGERYPVKNDIFKATYERAEE